MIFQIFVCVFFLIVLGIMLNQRRALDLLKHLCDLRQGATDYYREQLKLQTSGFLIVKGRLNEFVKRFKHFVAAHPESIKKEISQFLNLSKLKLINSDLVEEISQLLEVNSGLEQSLNQLRINNDKIVKLKSENRQLRLGNSELETSNTRLTKRNEDLEYAINLESISMIEKYQEEGKLFSAINDIRRSLSRILNPA